MLFDCRMFINFFYLIQNVGDVFWWVDIGACSPLSPGSQMPPHSTTSCLSTTFISHSAALLPDFLGPMVPQPGEFTWHQPLPPTSLLDSPPSHTPGSPLAYMGLCVPHLLQELYFLIVNISNHVYVLSHVWLFVTHGLEPTRLLCQWNSPGKDTGVGCHFLFQGMFLTQGWSPHHLPPSPALLGGFFTTWATWDALIYHIIYPCKHTYTHVFKSQSRLILFGV